MFSKSGETRLHCRSAASYFCKGASAIHLMFFPPQIVRTRRPVFCPLHRPVEGVPLLTGSVALPPVLLIEGHLVVETVVHGYLCPGFFVNSKHVFVEGRTVAVAVHVAVGDKQVGVNHFVQQRLHEVLAGTQLEEGDTQPTRWNAGL